MSSPYRRKRTGTLPLVDIQKEAHKIAFYPLLFQAVRCLGSLGILQELATRGAGGATREDVGKLAGLSGYAVSLLLETAEALEIIKEEEGIYTLTRLGHYLATDTSVQINMSFTHHLCYQGAFALDTSLQKGTPEGLKHFGDWPTIYEGLAQLPDAARKSWFDFDNHYSDLLFDKAVKIVLQGQPQRVFDLGGNTGKFDLALLQADPMVTAALFDLPPQLKTARQTLAEHGLESRATFHAIDVLKDEEQLPKGADVIWMSQFLDCFTEDQIVSILTKVRLASTPETRVFILEPFVDGQHSGTQLALLAISLYFTCMANGNSRFYKKTVMEGLIRSAGLRIAREYPNMGPSNYTLLECQIVTG